jgi:phage-related protein
VIQTVWSAVQTVIQTAVGIVQTIVQTVVGGLITWWNAAWPQIQSVVSGGVGRDSGGDSDGGGDYRADWCRG